MTTPPPANRLEVSVASQRVRVFRDEVLVGTFPVSSAAAGTGFEEGSLKTPLGRFEVAEKIGDGAPWGTIFRGRIPQGCWHRGESEDGDLILSRILRLRGLDPENANTWERYIYFHGTNDEASIGSPASHGCIRLTNDDMIRLFDLVEPGTLVSIVTDPAPPMKIVFFDCDSTLSAIEGVDELARLCGPDVFREVETLTNAAMNGEIPIDEIFARRLEIIRPTREVCEEVGRGYIERIEPGCLETVEALRQAGWEIVILSGGFEPVIQPFARHLGISSLEAVPLYFHEDGTYAGFDAAYPTTRNGGKPEIIRQWKERLSPDAVVMIGDGISDLETLSEVDLFVGYGGVVSRPRVLQEAPVFVHRLLELPGLLETHLASSTRG